MGAILSFLIVQNMILIKGVYFSKILHHRIFKYCKKCHLINFVQNAVQCQAQSENLEITITKK